MCSNGLVKVCVKIQSLTEQKIYVVELFDFCNKSQKVI